MSWPNDVPEVSSTYNPFADRWADFQLRRLLATVEVYLEAEEAVPASPRSVRYMQARAEALREREALRDAVAHIKAVAEGEGHNPEVVS